MEMHVAVIALGSVAQGDQIGAYLVDQGFELTQVEAREGVFLTGVKLDVANEAEARYVGDMLNTPHHAVRIAEVGGITEFELIGVLDTSG